ncbi:MAG: hypothetical protein WCY47_08410 [Pusillimonas sp.]|uniref:hypothetical protein n=1 Tax=Zwartia vadi TaxID=3058168 RepID=UPI0025B4F2E6|nr:hypothetical protein [Zwartia vadi]MDN3988520.1 hypothetical protein [Zwartia vadi]
MDDPLSELVRVRLSRNQYRKLSEAAAISGQNLSTYIRHRLAAIDTLAEELSLLRQAVNRLSQISEAHAASIESVLLARALARPEQIAIAHASMKRLGIASFPA